LDALRLPPRMIPKGRRYLDPLNFATNFVFFRDADGLATRLVTANYWSGYGGGELSLWCLLFDQSGNAIAEWEESVPPGAGSIVIDSAEVRRRFALPEFTGQLFLHALGAVGHDVVKYALDIYGKAGEPSLSSTHDANSWPADYYAGLPAPDTRRRDQAQPHGRDGHASARPGGRALRQLRARCRQPPAAGALAAADRD